VPLLIDLGLFDAVQVIVAPFLVWRLPLAS
jgi:hypothetical protein